MRQFTVEEITDRMNVYGRSFYEETEGALYSSYTCGTWEFRFKGTTLIVDFASIPDTFVPPNAPKFPGEEPPKKEDWPWIAVFLDGQDVPYKKMAVAGDRTSVLVFQSEEEEEHVIRIVKLTEYFRTALGITGVRMEGELLALDENKKDAIEFIGDSITCGFGNGTNDANREFYAAEEDGFMTHGAIAARTLGLEPRFISVSGISIENAVSMPGFYCMNDLYPYTDRILEDKRAASKGETISEYQRYDFAAHPVKYVVLNLGTNDANQIYFAPDEAKEQAEKAFEENYYQFVSKIRELNGPETKIICALGCMDYYLYDKIRDVVAKWKQETGDERIYTLKYNKMMNVGPDVGGCLHPSIKRHKKMADDLVKFIRSIE